MIVHYGNPGFAHDAVVSVLDDPSTTNREVVVVDNAGGYPNAGSPGGVQVVPSEDNPGYGAGLNRGVRLLQESGSFRAFVCLNNDVALLPGYLDAAGAALGNNGVGAAGGLTFEDPEQSSIWYSGGSVNFAFGTVHHNRSPVSAEKPRTVGFIPGAAIAIKPRAWEQLGGFDERYFLYHEDLDFCLRLRRERWGLRFDPKMRAIHRLGAATGSRQRSALYLEHMTRTRLRPFRPLPYRLYLAVLHSGWVLIRSAALIARGDPGARAKTRALFRGHRDALATVFDR